MTAFAFLCENVPLIEINYITIKEKKPYPRSLSVLPRSKIRKEIL
jgi:hypothetical protein